jgi:hypothetical protein
MAAIREEGAPGGHRLDVLQVPLPIQLKLYAQLPCNYLDQCFRLVNVELIDHKDPPGIGVGGYRLVDVRGEVLIGAGLTYGGSDHPAGCHLQVGDHKVRVPWRTYSCS